MMSDAEVLEMSPQDILAWVKLNQGRFSHIIERHGALLNALALAIAQISISGNQLDLWFIRWTVETMLETAADPEQAWAEIEDKYGKEAVERLRALAGAPGVVH